MHKQNWILIGWVGVWGITGCALDQHHDKRITSPAPAAPAPAAPGSVITPNTHLNPSFSAVSQLQDPFIYTDTVQHMAPNTVTLQVNDLFQTLVTGYARFKYPLTAQPGAPSDGPDILVWFTYLTFDPRWSISRIFVVDATVELKVDVKKNGKIIEKVLRASGQGHGENAFMDATKAAMRNSIPVLDQYLTSLNL